MALLLTTTRLARTRLAHAARRRRGFAAVTQTVPDEEFQKIKDELTSFMHDRIYPNEQLFLKQSHESRGRDGREWTHPSLIVDLMQEAKQRGLWNLFLPADSAKLAPSGSHLGRGLTNLQYADLCELMGTSVHFEFAATACNCASPDTGNMETIARFGSEEQKEQWLAPLLDGSIRSCFAMTEPDVASSDATNISIDIKDDGDDFVVNGRKWWCTGAGSLHCKVMILMGKTDPDAKAFAQQSMLLVDLASTEGIELVRPLTVFGDDDAPKGHFELAFNDVRIPKSNVLWQRGKGFEIAQRRLGPGRIHHCMRCIGQMERALATMAQRAMKRVAFGKPLAARDSVLEDVARIRAEIDGCRHLVREAASLMDLKGNTDLETRQRLSLVKALVPHTLQSIADRAMQLHGGAGVSGDTPLTTIWATGRGLRLADGPDAVHWRKAGQLEFERQRSSPLAPYGSYAPSRDAPSFRSTTDPLSEEAASFLVEFEALMKSS